MPQANRQTAENLVYWPVNQSKQPTTRMISTQTNDEDLAARWRQHMHAVAESRDKQAYRALYQHFAPKIKSFYLNQGLKSNAEELTHEVFLKIWQKAGTYNASKANVSTWIFTIVRNLRIDFLRRKRITEVSDEDTVEVGEDGQLETDFESLRNSKKLVAAFSLLNQEQRNVLQKVYFEDKSHQHAAVELEMTPGVVKSRIRSALKVLRSHMGGE